MLAFDVAEGSPFSDAVIRSAVVSRSVQTSLRGAPRASSARHVRNPLPSRTNSFRESSGGDERRAASAGSTVTLASFSKRLRRGQRRSRSANCAAVWQDVQPVSVNVAWNGGQLVRLPGGPSLYPTK